MTDSSLYCASLAKALLELLQKRFSGLLDNLKPLVNDGSPASTCGSKGPFGALIYPVAASLDPEFRMAWLDEWQDDWDATVKSRVTGTSIEIVLEKLVAVSLWSTCD